MRYGCMYSGWSPLLRTKFWKKELVGRGEARVLGEKKREGSGRTVDCVSGNRKADWFSGHDHGDGGDIGGFGSFEGLSLFFSEQ